VAENELPTTAQRRSSVRLALIIAAVALAMYLGLWLKASL